MPPEAPDAWADVIQPAGMSRLDPIYIVPAPPRRWQRRPRILLRIVLMVVLPTLLTGLYFSMVAADRYMAEARFVIRKPGGGPRGPAQSLSLDDGPKGFGGDDSYALRDFLLSRDALRLLLDNADFRAALTRAGDDWVWRFPSALNGSSDEKLYALYQSLVNVEYDSSTSVTTLRVEAFRPEDARRIALVLMEGGEALVNRMSEHARSDAVRVAAEEVARNENLALAAEDRVTAFRDRESVIDPTQVSKTVLKTIGALSLQMVETRAQLDVTMRASPNSPQIPPLRSRVTAIQQQIDHERDSLAGNDRSLAPRIAEYERLTLERGFAENTLISSLNLREAARLDALRQQEYLERVVEPHVADEAQYPWRIRWTVAAFLAGCFVFWMFRPRPAAHP